MAFENKKRKKEKGNRKKEKGKRKKEIKRKLLVHMYSRTVEMGGCADGVPEKQTCTVLYSTPYGERRMKNEERRMKHGGQSTEDESTEELQYEYEYGDSSGI